jgi:hypothetical protein
MSLVGLPRKGTKRFGFSQTFSQLPPRTQRIEKAVSPKFGHYGSFYCTKFISKIANGYGAPTTKRESLQQ